MKQELNVDSDEVMGYEPDYTVRDIIGKDVNLKDVFTAERIKACQDVIDKARTEFFEEEKLRVMELRNLISTSNPGSFTKIISISNDIKCQARIFGFSFIADLCGQIVMFATNESKPIKVRFKVMSKFSDALMLAIMNKMKDEGGVLEKELDKVVAEVLSKV